jgi:general secretion pathway protein M
MMETYLNYWRQLKMSERRLILAAFWVILAALLWLLAIAPALKTIKEAPEQHRALDAKLQSMRVLSVEAKTLQSQPKLGLDEAQKALQSAVSQRFGSAAQLNLAGERATLTLKNANPQELAQWLTQARVNARALPGEAKLNKIGDGWDGTLVLNLPKK